MPKECKLLRNERRIMKSEESIRLIIETLTKSYDKILQQPAATTDKNAKLALRQLNITTSLDAFYWVLSERRPELPCDKRPDGTGRAYVVIE